MSRFWVVLLCLLSLPAVARAQARPSSAAKPPVQSPHVSSIQNQHPPEYSKEPFVIERYATTARFENDGTGEQVLTVRVHVQSDAGAQQLQRTRLPIRFSEPTDGSSFRSRAQSRRHDRERHC